MAGEHWRIHAPTNKAQELLDQLVALQRDADRYRWLRDQSGADIRTLLGVGDFTSMDAFIDARIADVEGKA